MNIHAFIFSWKDHYDRAVMLEKKLSKIVDKVTVINSDELNTPNHWINLTDDAYFAEQFLTACDHLDGDIMLHVQADVSYDDWKSVVNSACKYYNKYGFGIYSPNIDYTDITYSDFDNLKLPEDANLKFVSNTDCSAWFIDRSVIDYFYKKFKNIYFKTKFGWGICYCLSAIAIQLHMPVFRDYAFILQHPKSRNYSSEKAEKGKLDFYKNIFKIDSTIFQIIEKLKIKDARMVIKRLKHIPFKYITQPQKCKV
jgi:hypothetical protein